MKLTLQQHIGKSREAVAANKAKGNRHAEFLATMYAQPSRFIEEILQNTEDAYARKSDDQSFKTIRFKLLNDRIEIHHNGKDFDEDDLMSITTFANTTKHNYQDVNQIGKFGIGFKSVFSVTDSPEIHCKPYHYKITDYEVLEETKPLVPDAGFNTLIVLPFKKKEQAECYSAVKQGFGNLDEYFLIFLKQIQQIEIFENGKLASCIEKQEVRLSNNIRKQTFLKKKFAAEISEKQEVFLVVTMALSTLKSQNELAFKVDKNGDSFKFIEIRNAPLFAFFPTKMMSGLNFLVHAPFTTNPLRDFIPFDLAVAPENLRLVGDLTQLFIISLNSLDRMGCYSLHLLSLLPIQTPVESSMGNANNKIYREFYNALKHYLSRKNTIPISKSKTAVFREVLIPGDKTIYLLLKHADLKKLFQKKYFIDSEIVQDAYAELREYFTEVIQIKSGDAESFAFRIVVTPDFLEGKTIQWLVKFYTYVHAHPRLWNVQHKSNYFNLRNAAIILTNDNKLVAPYSETHQPSVFLPHGKKSNLPVVHKRLLKKTACKQFFNDIGIGEPELMDEIETNIIPQFSEDTTLSKNVYYAQFRKIMLVYESASDIRKEEIIESLKDKAFILAANIVGEMKYLKADEVYFHSSAFNTYFNQRTDIFYIEPKLLLNFSRRNPTVFNIFLQKLGLNTFPRISTDEVGNISIDGFKSFLQNMDMEKSRAFIKLLIAIDRHYLTDAMKTYISKAKWLFSDKNVLVAPSSIKVADIHKKYNFRNGEPKILANMLKFVKSGKASEQNHLDWNPGISPEKVSNRGLKNQIPIEFQVTNNFSLIAQTFTLFPIGNNSNIDLATYSDDDMEKIQQWSLKFVMLHLKAKYEKEHYEMNISNESEIVLVKDNRVEQHIFVSGKTALMASFPIGGKEFSAIIAALDAVENTFLYLVSSAGSEDAEIKIYPNPLKLFQQGTIQITSPIWISPL